MPKKTVKKSFNWQLYLALSVISLLILPITIAGLSSRQNQETFASSINPIGQSGNWNMIFSDEFNAATLDTTKWTPGWFGTGITGPVNTSEIACYDSALAKVPGDGNLHLQLIDQQQTCKGSTRQLTGSLVSSNGKFQYTYGYVEFRAFLATASAGVIANWPATWSDGQNWPTDGENDTMEGLGGKACYHFHSPSGGPGECAQGDFTGWHTFGSHWQPGSVTYYYDGVKVGEITTGITSSPQYLIMNNSQGQYGGSPKVPAEILIDYVRVWQAAPPTVTTVPVNTPTPTPIPAQPTATNVPSAPTSTPVPASVSVTYLQETGSSKNSPAKVNFTVKTTGTLAVSTIGVAVRNQNNQSFDFPTSGSVTLSGTQSFTSSRTFPKGNYKYWVFYAVNGNYNNLSPTKTFSIK